jgi:ketosteroid isomerase-like protein
MSDQAQDREAVRQAADYLIERFGAFDRDAYFACFAPEATFIFHTTDRIFASRAEYEAEWATWIEIGFSVLSCTSHDQRIDFPTSDVAVFTHRVLTTIRDETGDQDLIERESIIFRREPNGTWQGVHEHLSPHP